MRKVVQPEPGEFQPPTVLLFFRRRDLDENWNLKDEC